MINKTKKKRKAKLPLSYRGISCDSSEEVYFLMWANEAMEAGLIENITRAESYLLSEPVFELYTEEKQLKTKTKTVDKRLEILRGHIYTPEFKFELTEKGEKLSKSIVNPTGLFFPRTPDSWEVMVEIKPLYDQNNMTRLFKINQKWVYTKYQEMVNLIIPETLFKATFVPKDYLKTPTGKPRKINYEVKTIQDWSKDLINNNL